MHRHRRISLFILLLLTVGIVGSWMFWPRGVKVVASRPEVGGWSPDVLTVQVGEPLHLRLTAEDMMHGFAVGGMVWEPVDIPPGETTEIILLFDEPGTYTFYCTRFCSINHWRMRGTIKVIGDGQPSSVVIEPPPYVKLKLDIDAPHLAEITFVEKPNAAQGSTLDVEIPTHYLTRETLVAYTPVQIWQQLRAEGETAVLSDTELWDLVAAIWQTQTTLAALEQGEQLYKDNCLSCHGPGGAGDGPIVGSLETAVPDFTDPTTMLGASSALLHGKIIRGGMGTGMPNWGTIFTEEETWALIDYLWTFQFGNLAPEVRTP
jgi:mono/diheme cytochrome c family protein/plastocyanin